MATVVGSGALTVYDLASGSSTVLVAGGVTDFAWLPDGKNLLYITGAGSLGRASVSSTPSPTVLISQGVKRFVNTHLEHQIFNYRSVPAVSPNGRWVLVASASGISEFLLAATDTPGAPVSLAAAAEYPGTLGDCFTTDSADVLYATGFGAATAPSGIPLPAGTLQRRPVAGGAAAAVSTGKVNKAVPSGSRLVYGDNFAIDANGFETSDLTVMELATQKRTPLLSQVSVFYLDSNETRIVSCVMKGPSPGIYVHAIP